jgi:sulfite exporter TauE/SafE
MELWTAFLLGLVGSLHCAGMCGPIALAIPSNVNSTSRFLLSRLAYNLGRIATYCLLGALFGLIGKSFALIGWQRWVSLCAGVSILIALLISSRVSLSARVSKPIAFLKTIFAKLLRQSTLTSTFSLGALNGFLPCGLAYAACAGAAATSGFITGISYMTLFGLGTIPMMLGIGLAGKKLQFALRFKFQKLIPVTLILMSLLLIFRGLALGIPYLSPDLAHGSCCHP